MSDKIKAVHREPNAELEDQANVVAMHRPVSRGEFEALKFELNEVKRLFFAILDEAAKED
jgi:hypothetical protein